MNVDDSTLKSLSASLSLRQMRHEIIASNIANADTPGFKTKRLSFEDALANALDIEKMRTLKTGDKKHHNVGGGGLESVEPQVFEDPNGIVSGDGNTVNREEELALLAKNKILFDAAVLLMNKKLGLMKYAVGSDR